MLLLRRVQELQRLQLENLVSAVSDHSRIKLFCFEKQFSVPSFQKENNSHFENQCCLPLINKCNYHFVKLRFVGC